MSSWCLCLDPAGAANMLAGQKKNLFAVAKTWYQQFSVHTLSLIQGNRSVCGFHLGYLDSESELIAQAMAVIMDLYKQGKIKPRIDSTYHLEQVNEWMSDGGNLNWCACGSSLGKKNMSLITFGSVFIPGCWNPLRLHLQQICVGVLSWSSPQPPSMPCTPSTLWSSVFALSLTHSFIHLSLLFLLLSYLPCCYGDVSSFLQ